MSGWGCRRADAVAEAAGTDGSLVGELASDAGHGTFIAGLVRQACPEALILDIRLYGDQGVVAEYDLLRNLQLLALRQLRSRTGRSKEPAVDVVALSLGYYHEQPGDAAFDSLLHGPLRLLGKVRRSRGRLRRQRRHRPAQLSGGVRAVPGRRGPGRDAPSSRSPLSGR